MLDDQRVGQPTWNSGAASGKAGTYKKNKKIHSDEPLPIEASEVDTGRDTGRAAALFGCVLNMSIYGTQ